MSDNDKYHQESCNKNNIEITVNFYTSYTYCTVCYPDGDWIGHIFNSIEGHFHYDISK